MPALSNRPTDWPREDWDRYYSGTYIYTQSDGPCKFIETASQNGVQKALLVSEAQNKQVLVPLSQLTWANLRHPKIGWIVLGGIPVYLIKRPLRDPKKGLRKELLLPGIPKFVDQTLEEIAGSNHSRLYTQRLLNFLDIGSLFSPPSVSLEEGLHRLRTTAELGVALTTEVALIHHPDPTPKRTFVICAGMAIAGYVGADGTIEQVGDVDVGSVLHAPAD